MHRLFASVMLVLWPAIAIAQEWRFRSFDDGSFFSGDIHVDDSSGWALRCGERSPRGLSPVQTGNVEPDVTPPGTLRVNLGTGLIGAATLPGARRDDVMIVIGTNGYRLPAVRWNELFGTWQTDLAASDELFTALSGAGGAELRSNLGSRAMPVAGFAAAYQQLMGYCQTMFASIAKPWPGGVPPVKTDPAGAENTGPMHRAAEASITRGCNGAALREPSYLLVGEIDGDGVPDTVVDWRAVQCQTELRRPFCGASMCSATVFLSSRFPATGRPEDLLALGVKLVPLSNGNQGVSVGGSLSMCAQRGSNACQFIFFWNGSALTELR